MRLELYLGRPGCPHLITIPHDCGRFKALDMATACQAIIDGRRPAEALDFHAHLKQAIIEVEKWHFRTVEDTGAHPNAIVVMNCFRRLAGLPYIGKEDLPVYTATFGYCHPLGSKLLTSPSNKT